MLKTKQSLYGAKISQTDVPTVCEWLEPSNRFISKLVSPLLLTTTNHQQIHKTFSISLQHTNASMLHCLLVSTKIQSSKPNKLPHRGHTTYKTSDLWKQTSVLGNTRKKKKSLYNFIFFVNFFLGERQTPYRSKLHIKTKCNAKLITSLQVVTS